VFRDELKKSFQLRREGEEGRDCLEKRIGEFLGVSVDDSLNVFFLETWKLEAVGFIEVYFALPISLLFQNRRF
jgi:hypothetical protein